MLDEKITFKLSILALYARRLFLVWTLPVWMLAGSSCSFDFLLLENNSYFFLIMEFVLEIDETHFESELFEKKKYEILLLMAFLSSEGPKHVL
ncbi:hypothetical protein BpHYR1_008520 [Brachionus plicatilis]|uniref:Uncharacterized protein n=1 Tax=Brachionus plicatilis TaxID=10195 RepID=A0A3M7T4Z8_BRAPC|nr:hypothetical protein BpHYR1_008520 [Brachionus plicatilis]